jgi:hypothetical protein
MICSASSSESSPHRLDGADDGALVGQQAAPCDGADQERREERDHDQPEQQCPVLAAPECDHVGERIADRDREHGGGSGIQERPLELRAEVGEGLDVVAEVPVELRLDGESAGQRRQRQSQQREQRRQVEEGEPEHAGLQQPVRGKFAPGLRRAGDRHHHQRQHAGEHQRQRQDGEGSGQQTGADRREERAGADQRPEPDELGALDAGGARR